MQQKSKKGIFNKDKEAKMRIIDSFENRFDQND